MSDHYEKKYLKYKSKYLNLKNLLQVSGSATGIPSQDGKIILRPPVSAEESERRYFLHVRAQMNEMVSKTLADLKRKTEAEKDSLKDSLKRKTEEVLSEIIAELTVSEIRALDKKVLAYLGNAVDKFVKDGKTKDLDKAIKAAKDSLAKASGSATPAASGEDKKGTPAKPASKPKTAAKDSLAKASG